MDIIFIPVIQGIAIGVAGLLWHYYLDKKDWHLITFYVVSAVFVLLPVSIAIYASLNRYIYDSCTYSDIDTCTCLYVSKQFTASLLMAIIPVVVSSLCSKSLKSKGIKTGWKSCIPLTVYVISVILVLALFCLVAYMLDLYGYLPKRRFDF